MIHLGATQAAAESGAGHLRICGRVVVFTRGEAGGMDIAGHHSGHRLQARKPGGSGVPAPAVAWECALPASPDSGGHIWEIVQDLPQAEGS